MTAAAAPVTTHALPRRVRQLDSIGVLIAILLWKLGFFATTYLAWELLPLNGRMYVANYRYGDRNPDSWADSFVTWDSQHYIRLAEVGYEEGLLSNAFGPLYPTLIRATNVVTGDSVLSGLLIANVASAVALYLLYRLVARRWSPEVGFATVLLCMAFPTAFYLNLIYTEGLFLLLLVALFYSLYERRYWITAITAFLLPLLRVPGLVALVPMAWMLGKEAVRFSFEGGRLRFDGLQWRRELLLLLAPLAGFAAYLLWMHVELGNAFVAMDTEKLFVSHRSLENVLRPDKLVADFFRSSYAIHGYLDSAIDRIFFVVFLVSLPVVYLKTDKPMFLFYAVVGFQPLLGSFMSYTRLVMVAFPLYIAWAAVFTRWEPRLTYAVAYPMLLLQAVFLALHINSNWVA